MDRLTFSQQFNTYLQSINGVIAIWEAGSAATNQLDTYSDLDLSILCQVDQVEGVIKSVLEYLQTHHGIKHQFRMPEPTWHGFSQCFIEIENMPELFYLDIVFIKETLKDWFLESDRHGIAQVWYDPSNRYHTTKSTEEDIHNRVRRVYKQATAIDFLTELEFLKALKRKSYTDAFVYHFQYLNRHLIPLLNILHRKEKCDFGIRYINRDYPKMDFEKIQALLIVTSIEEIEMHYHVMKAWFESLKQQLQMEE